MECGKCEKHFSECICPDLEERLDEVVAGGKFAYKYCMLCEKHYERCKCAQPVWGVKGEK